MSLLDIDVQIDEVSLSHSLTLLSHNQQLTVLLTPSIEQTDEKETRNMLSDFYGAEITEEAKEEQRESPPPLSFIFVSSHTLFSSPRVNDTLNCILFHPNSRVSD